MKQGGGKWLSIGTGAAGAYACAVVLFLTVMAMEPTPADLRTTAWILAVIGLFVFSAIYARLFVIRAARDNPESTRDSDARVHARYRTELAIAAVCNLVVFGLCGLVWVFAQKAQCLIQSWVLGLVVAEGCT